MLGIEISDYFKTSYTYITLHYFITFCSYITTSITIEEKGKLKKLTCSVNFDVLQLLLTRHHPHHHLALELRTPHQAPHGGPHYSHHAQPGHH